MDSTKATEASTVTSVDYSQGCFSRLACGVCMVTGRMCPLVPMTIQPTWGTINKVTCEAHT